MIGIKVSGNFKSTESLIDRIRKRNYYSKLKSFGEKGISALSSATPKDTGKTADSWGYKIVVTNDYVKIVWTNDNRTEMGNPIAVLIQYGHITGSGGYVEGIDYINPAIQPIFKDIADTIWKEVNR